jgi:hypothetical protein
MREGTHPTQDIFRDDPPSPPPLPCNTPPKQKQDANILVPTRFFSTGLILTIDLACPIRYLEATQGKVRERMGPLAEAAIGKAGIVRPSGGALNTPLVQGGGGGGGGGDRMAKWAASVRRRQLGVSGLDDEGEGRGFVDRGLVEEMRLQEMLRLQASLGSSGGSKKSKKRDKSEKKKKKKREKKEKKRKRDGKERKKKRRRRSSSDSSSSSSSSNSDSECVSSKPSPSLLPILLVCSAFLNG